MQNFLKNNEKNPKNPQTTYNSHSRRHSRPIMDV